MKKILSFVLVLAMALSSVACGGEKTSSSDEETKQSKIESEDTTTKEETPEIESEDTTTKEETPEQESENTASTEEPVVDENKSDSTGLVDGMRPEFKEAMDSYEAFYDEYCDFLAKYNANPTDTKLIAEYTDMMTKLVDMDEKFENWENNDLNDEELKYYIEVNGRITQKMLDVAY